MKKSRLANRLLAVELEYGESDGPDADKKAGAVQEGESSNPLLLHYFGEIRQFQVPSRAEEQMFCHRIVHAQKRERQALARAPMALAILVRVLQRVRGKKAPLSGHFRLPVASRSDLLQEFADAVRELQDIARRLPLQKARLTGRTSSQNPVKRRIARQTYVALWKQWFKVWEALGLHHEVYDAIRQAIQAEHAAHPHDQGLNAAYGAWRRAQDCLNQRKDTMIRANLRLVIHMAQRYWGHGIPLLDLIQDGNIGLMRALDTFDPSRGIKFSTYAHWWVRQAISRAVGQQYRIIRLPNHLRDHEHKLRVALDDLERKYDRHPTSEELGAALQLTAEEVEALQMAIQPILSVQQPFTEKGDSGHFIDVLQDDRPRPDELLAGDQLRHALGDCLAGLTEREELIVRMRYGLNDKQGHTLQEVADMLGLSRERVRQLEQRAFEKLRQPHRRDLLEEFL